MRKEDESEHASLPLEACRPRQGPVAVQGWIVIQNGATPARPARPPMSVHLQRECTHSRSRVRAPGGRRCPRPASTWLIECKKLKATYDALRIEPIV
jgi:hypothetical protein